MSKSILNSLVEQITHDDHLEYYAENGQGRFAIAGSDDNGESYYLAYGNVDDMADSEDYHTADTLKPAMLDFQPNVHEWVRNC